MRADPYAVDHVGGTAPDRADPPRFDTWLHVPAPIHPSQWRPRTHVRQSASCALFDAQTVSGDGELERKTGGRLRLTRRFPKSSDLTGVRTPPPGWRRSAQSCRSRAIGRMISIRSDSLLCAGRGVSLGITACVVDGLGDGLNGAVDVSVAGRPVGHGDSQEPLSSPDCPS